MPRYNPAVAMHEVQLVVITEHVAHIEAHGSQLIFVLFVMYIPGVQLTRQFDPLVLK